MKFGWCGTIDMAGQIEAAGLDYVELQLVPMNLDDDSAFASAKRSVAAMSIPVAACSYLFPKDVRVVGPDVDEDRNRRYVDRVVEIMSIARAQVLVLGSGWTRNIPENWGAVAAEQQFLSALSWIADALKGSGGTLVIEPLNRKESNFITSVSDGVRLAKMLDRSDVRGLADFYHMDEECEPLSEVGLHAPWLGHVHVADTGRLNPGTGTYDFDTFFRHLRAGGYRGSISAECGLLGDPVAAMRSSPAFLRQKWAEASGP